VGYRLVRGIVRLLLWLFYRRIDIVGRDRIPLTGPVIVTPNHHNALVDAMLVVATFPRPIRVLAKSTLFRHPLIAPFLWLMGGVPVYRRVESGDDPRKNDEMFAAVVGALRAGGMVLIFPEGRSQPQPTVLPLRTGVARILLETEGAAAASGAGAGVTILPVGLAFHEPGIFRSASVVVKIGAPLPVADALDLARRDPAQAVRLLTDRLHEAIRAQTVEAEDQHTLDLLVALEHAWWEEAARRGEPTGLRDPAQSLAWRQQVAQGATALAATEPERVREVRRRLENYRARLDEAGVTGEQLGRPYTVGLVSRYVGENLLWLALALPLALWGIVCHAVPYWLTGVAARLIRSTAEEEATDKMAAGVVLYPVLWIAEGWVVWRLAGGRALAVFAILLVPAGLLALAWRERLGEVARQARAFFRFLGDRELHRSLMLEREALVEEVRGLAARVPPAAGVPRGADGR
jgi:glycerol-3-phosphate O-acyltransferase / dihydroxyacetone phosphate acyltransferase